MSNIPPRGSIPPNVRDNSIKRTDSTMRGRIGSVKRSGAESNFRPEVVKKKSRSTASVSSWPERAEPEVTGDAKNIWVIVEFPRHTDISQVEWEEQEGTLVLQSTLLNCPYTNKIALPEDRGERADIKLNNGLLVVTFEKQHPL